MYGAKELAESFRTVRKNTIQVAEDIPADKYDHHRGQLMLIQGLLGIVPHLTRRREGVAAARS
jgi:hypothetical protein